MNDDELTDTEIIKEIKNEITRKPIETYRLEESDDYIKGRYDALFDINEFFKIKLIETRQKYGVGTDY